ncbi:MAG: GntR family transcriptional regulator [Planctomycetota bacterium]|jgi:DNA-binding LacI/PurR family transcriptional regulator
MRERIVAGDYALGRFLPPVRELSTEHGVSPETVRRGLKALEVEGLLRCVPRHGFRVLGRANDPARACPIAFVTSYRREMADAKPTDRALSVAFGEATSEREWSLITMHTAGLPHDAVIEKLRIARAWGVILDTVDEKLIRVVKRLDIPCVMVNAWSEHVQMDTVIQDNYRGGFLAAEELARRGLKRIAWIGRVRANCHSRERYAGAVAGLLEAGLELPSDLRFETEPGPEDSREQALKMLSSKDRPEGVLALWTGVGRAVKAAADELGLVVGRDFHMVGWSAREHYESEYRAAFEPAALPPAVVWSVESMADTALARLAERRANPHLERVRVSIPTGLRAAEED